MATKSLFEAYKNRLAVADTVYSKSHNGEKMSGNRKLVTAKVLENTNKFLNEAFEQSVGTQRSDMGLYKKFALNLTTVALPNLIAHDLVIVHPMSSMSGYITYIQYQYAANKGDTKVGDRIADPFGFYGAKGVDADFTASRVVETVPADASELALAWTPVVTKAFKTIVVDGVEVEYNPTFTNRYTAEQKATIALKGVKITKADKTVVFADVEADGKTVKNVAAGDRIAYCYDNVVVPQNDLPMIKAEMKSISLVAKARRIAIYYSQIAAYQAKTDYGVDLGDQLAEKAVGELSYEIDTEITNLLSKMAGDADPELVWSKTLPVGVSKVEHYEGFTEVIEIAKQKIYDRTQKFAPNYAIVASNLLPVISVCKGWNAAPAGQINGPYFAGTLNGLKIFVTPNIEAGRFVIGVNGNDMMSSAAVYAPYMAIVPTQLLGYADGGMSQGWSTMYALEELNHNLVIAGRLDA